MATRKEIQEAWEEILTGRRTVRCEGLRISLRFPTFVEQSTASQITDGVEERLREFGILTSEEADSLLRERGLWDDSKEQRSEKLRAEILKLEQNLERTKLEKAKRRISEKIRSARIELSVIERPRFDVISRTTAFISADFKASLLAASCAEFADFPGKRVWKDFREMMSDSRGDFVWSVIYQMRDFMSGMSHRTLRSIARMPNVYSRWLSCQENSSPFFDEPVATMNPNRAGLLQWLRYYLVVSKSFGDPPDGYIDDDQAFDSWVKQKVQEMKARQEEAEKGRKGRTRTVTHIFSKGGK